ncbi:MAG: hypothetical protein ACYC46_11470 [Acidobacteriaceae bacterium]
MKNIFITTFMTALFAVGALAQAKAHSKTIVVETPADLPALAQADSSAMYLHHTNDGRTFLYIENNNGSKLSILNVTDPASIRQIAQVPVSAPAAYDFVRNLNDVNELIRYRDGSGFAILNLKKYNRPVMEEAPQFNHVASMERIGQTGLLLRDATHSFPTAPLKQKYVVMDVANPGSPHLLVTVAGVEQQLSRPDTGTLFLLNQEGITVVRRLRVEADHTALLIQQTGN